MKQAKRVTLVKPLRITVAWLRRHHACADQVALFRTHWPDGATITPQGLRKAARVGLDLIWFAGEYLPPAAWATYDAACATAWTTYDAARATAWATYDAACVTAGATYDAACATAWTTCDAACATAWATRDAAVRAAWATCNAACATALWSVLRGAR